MSSTQSTGNGSEEQTRNCPDCGEEMKYDAIREHGTEFETTEYMGWWCSSCCQGMWHCGECDSLHHPDFECLPKQEARLKEAQEEVGGKAKIPRYGKIPIEQCETTDDGDPVYIVEDRCPNTECNGDLIFALVRNDNFAKKYPDIIEYEFEAIFEYCSELEDGECSYRR